MVITSILFPRMPSTHHPPMHPLSYSFYFYFVCSCMHIQVHFILLHPEVLCRSLGDRACTGGCLPARIHHHQDKRHNNQTEKRRKKYENQYTKQNEKNPAHTVICALTPRSCRFFNQVH